MNLTETPIIIPPAPDDNVTDLLEQRVAATPDRVIFATPAGENWNDVTAAQFREQVISLAKGLAASGVQPGDRIAFMCKTSFQWTLVDFALHYAGAVMVPVYETSSALQMHWILEDSGARAIITENADHAARLAEVRGDLPGIELAWRMDEGALDAFVAAGAEVADEEIERRRTLARAADTATLIYTSGSTGRPKGVVLTHANFVDLSRNAAAGLGEVVEPGASTLLFVTLAHVYARFISILAVHAGVRVGHQPDTTKLLPSLGTFRPTFLLAVPRVFEKVYNSSEQKAEAGGKGKIFRAAALAAVRHSEAVMAGQKVPLGLKIKFALFDKLVYSKLREAMGGRVKYAVSGSAPLSHYLGHFYNSLGIKILEGYGLTETTAPVSVNLPDKYKIGTVGPALPGHTIRIAEDGEIEVKGTAVFKEYWQNAEATAAVFTDDGFFRTGDLGSLDSDGYLSITGRKKEILVTAGGKNVAPAALEDPIRSFPLIGQIVVVGDQKPFIAALITLDAEMLPTWLKNQGENPDVTLAEAAANPKVIAEVQRAVDHGNKYVSRAESIRKWVILPTEFTEASGHLTPKMSIKRDNILRDYAGEISKMYGDNPQTETVSTAG